MMATKRSILILALCLIALGLCLVALEVASAAHAQGRYDLSRWTVDGAGGTSSGGDYALSGTAGQAEVGALMQGGTYELAGGFWGVGTAGGHDVYLPLLLRSWP